MQLAAGTTIERYEVDGVLGQGGMAVVYRVRHLQLGSLHALKILTVQTPAIRERLLQEGRAQSVLRHPNVVTVTDVVEFRGSPALILEYVDGPSLDRLLAAGPLTLAQADHLARGILRGVAAAHRHGIVHRDLKPSNVLLAIQDGEIIPKVADFGLAKAVVGEAAGAVQTRSGTTLGTPAYMAPEQIRDARHVDGRADVFALGALLYELVTGQRAFQGADSFDVMTAVAAVRYLPPTTHDASLPPRVLDAIQGALRADPAERFADVPALLAAWLGGTEVASLHLSGGPAEELLARTESLRSEPGPLDVGTPSEHTWAPSLGEPAGSLVSAPPQVVPPSPTPSVAWAPRPALAFALGAIVAIPFIVGDLSLAFGSAGTGLREGGVAMGVVIACGVLAIGGAAMLASWELAGRRFFVAWLAAPVAMTMLGAVGMAMGLHATLQAVPLFEAADRYRVAATGISESLATQLAGYTLGASVASVATWALALLYRRTEQGPTPEAIAVIATTLCGGTLTWMLLPLLGAAEGPGGYLQFLLLCSLAVPVAMTAAPGGGRDADRARLLVGASFVFGASYAAKATDSLTVRYHFERLAATPVSEAISAADAYVSAAHSSHVLPVFAWTGLAALIALIPLRHLRALPISRAALGGSLVLLALTGASHLIGLDQLTRSGDVAIQTLLGEATRLQLGVVLTDSPEGPLSAGAVGALREGDVVAAVARHPVRAVRDVVERLDGCRCDRAVTCDFPGGCLLPGASVSFTVLRASDGGEPVLHEVALPWLGASASQPHAR